MGKEDLRIKKRQRMNYRGAKLPRKRGKVSTDGYPQTTERERNDGIEEVGMDQAKEKKANGSGGGNRVTFNGKTGRKTNGEVMKR